ncbi:uncharacterized protein PHACADRAFT_189405 [Phanerochaete carnosa HHB-10118-sp]|uniref:Uncharacterized protein n=1 Tax=Phanerochaete carnosa (strain HHB-10118-sp) TaxID=650164 RepID=K5W8K0_PHACS|nr:uncharacterized protein PHACADRAFT_189405 [Phanerochaete carnosa HHB-10118-sp]EKM60273.1 hypothetical protein PHACADRAFT_189405 [Phanerochaete carnosa HHB-10118-sp]
MISTDNSTALDGFPLVFDDQCLRLTSALPLGTNTYGLEEVAASSGFRRDASADGGVGMIQTTWARDIVDPIDQTVHGSYHIYNEHRWERRWVYREVSHRMMQITLVDSNPRMRTFGGLVPECSPDGSFDDDDRVNIL